MQAWGMDDKSESTAAYNNRDVFLNQNSLTNYYRSNLNTKVQLFKWIPHLSISSSFCDFVVWTPRLPVLAYHVSVLSRNPEMSGKHNDRWSSCTTKLNQFKERKYVGQCYIENPGLKVDRHTIEVSTSGLISDILKFNNILTDNI